MAYDDYEQGERVQEWLRRNGMAIVVGIVIGLGLIFGYRQWTQHQGAEHAAAANQYQLIRDAYAGGKKTQAETLTNSLLKNHADSAYAVFAATLRARQQILDGKPDDAIASMQWAVKHADEKPLKALSRLRLARVELDAGKAKQAVETLSALGGKEYPALAAELRGDAQVKLGHVDEADKAYREALSTFDADAPQRQIVQMKIDNLAVTAKAKPAPAGSTAASPNQDT